MVLQLTELMELKLLNKRNNKIQERVMEGLKLHKLTKILIYKIYTSQCINNKNK